MPSEWWEFVARGHHAVGRKGKRRPGNLPGGVCLIYGDGVGGVAPDQVNTRATLVAPAES
jgi:hypothetical protein